MECDHGVRSPGSRNDSSLTGILEYQRQVAQYHKDKAKTCSTATEHHANEEELAKRRGFLDGRRRNLLHKYRKDARLEDNEWIYEEEHHIIPGKGWQSQQQVAAPGKTAS
jgi:hypothetical protein